MACACEPSSDVGHPAVSIRLNCPICLETYKTPRVLPCVHTFCEGCLQSYILKQVEKGLLTSSITCPLCRKESTPSDLTKPPGDWVKQLPLNYAILPALESQGESESRKCDPCTVVSKTREAMSFCHDCEEYHCEECSSSHGRFSVMKGHKVVSLDEAAGQSSSKLKLGKIEFCEEHADKLIEFHCIDHKVLCCSTCAFIRHRGCRQVMEVKELGRGMKNKKEAKKLKVTMTKIQNCLGEATAILETNVTDIEAQCETLPTKLKDFRNKVLIIMDNLITEVSENSVQLKKMHTIKLNEQILNCRSLVAAIASLCTLLETVLEHGTKAQVFVTLHKVKDQVKHYEKMVADLTNNAHTVELRLDLDTVLKALVVSNQSLAKVSAVETGIKCLTELQQPALPMAERKITMSLVDIQKTRYLDQPCYNGVVVLPGGQMVVTDYRNKMCCVLDDKFRKKSHIKLSASPFNLAVIGDTEVVVLLEGINWLQCVSILPTLMFTKTIQLRKVPTCVASFSNSKLIVGYEKSFVVITLDGKEEIYVDRNMVGKCIKLGADDGLAVDVTTHRMYQSSEDAHVYCFELAGKPVFDYTNEKLKTPRRLALDFEGNVYVCSEGTKTVHQISPTGALIRVIATGMEEPYSICFYPDGQHLLVMNWIIGTGTTQALKMRFDAASK